MSLLQPPSASQMRAIQEDLGEDPDRLQNNVQLLQKWMSCQSHLPQDYDNNLLLVFLRGCKHNLERTKKKLEMYFVARTKVPELFCDRKPTVELLTRYNKMMKTVPLPKLTPDGHRVTIFKIMPCGPDIWDMKDVIRYVYMTGDIRVAEEVPIAGDIFVYDCQHLRPSHILNYFSPLLNKAIVAAHEAYPQRMKQLYIINPSHLVDKALVVARSFIKEKIRNRFVVQAKGEDLLTYFPADILPIEYGGTFGKFDDIVDEWTNYIIMHKKWFRQQDDIKATGPIPERLSYCQFNDVIGVEGSFRKLGID